MKLYHGSNVIIEEISLEKCRPYKDFGKGFYLTEIGEQAVKMAKRTSKIYGGLPIVTKFEFDESVPTNSNLRIKQFKKPDKDWALFVISNRNRDTVVDSAVDNNTDNRYDIVIGPIANDDLALLFRQFENGLITVDDLVKKMEYKELTNQYSFHTKEALMALKSMGAKDD